MCIRDSRHTIQRNAGDPRAAVIGGDDRASAVPDDAGSGRLQRAADRRHPAVGPETLNEPAETADDEAPVVKPGAVSYTHLDVYKRQALVRQVLLYLCHGKIKPPQIADDVQFVHLLQAV